MALSALLAPPDSGHECGVEMSEPAEENPSARPRTVECANTDERARFGCRAKRALLRRRSNFPLGRPEFVRCQELRELHLLLLAALAFAQVDGSSLLFLFADDDRERN